MKTAPKTPRRSHSANHYPSSRAAVWKFVILFTILVALASTSEIYMLQHQVGHAYRHAIAMLVAGLLGVADIPVQRNDTVIHVGAHSVEVAVECTGIKPTAIFCAAVIAFPCRWRSRCIGLATALLGVAVLNVLRIAALAFVAGYHHDSFDSMHALLMQGFLIVFVAPLWIGWMLWAIRRDQARSTSSMPPAT